ncbi:hypothetical protein HMPREF2537_01605 [Corynebacterium sp. HMSC074E01]|nr:hypothetical protein HMPREF2537_01605 [Corynebacterium sp. HMSC074E01]OFP63540.1 hypothetical protein HMPREF2978_10165 [Corynebacterium sp. HMSC074C01]OHO63321.1 hypothetical protein HMPREF2743_00790 [Corynebacterium sp. HMSC036D02]
MKRLLPLAAALFILSGCSSLDVESTPMSETPPSTSTSVTEDAPRPTLPAAEDSAEDVDVDQPQEEVIGFTEAPDAAQPTPMEKTIESCGDVSLHETGTTFFSDGTSGWTQQCADEMMAANPPVQEAAAVYEAPAVEENYVHPGAYCNGGSGVSKRGVPMTCAPASDGRMRWQSA